MIALLTFAVVVSVVAYRANFRLPRKLRTLAAVASFIRFGTAPPAYILVGGDQMPQDARLVTDKELKHAAETAR